VTAVAQAPPAPLTQWLRIHGARLAPISTAQTSDLRPFARIIGDARVAALGEPTHGAEEPLAFRNRLFRYLAADLGFTAIAIESSLADSRRVDAYVNGAAGDARAIARNHISYGFGTFGANVELLEWMRAYNANPVHTRKLHFYGIDLSLGGPGAGNPTAVPFADALDLLTRVDSSHAAQLRARLAPVLQLPQGSAFTVSDTVLDALIVAADELVSRVERARPQLVAMSADDYDWGHQSGIMALRALRMRRVTPPTTGDDIPPGAWEAVEVRDLAMADAVRWILDREGPRGRVLVFAHNGHVANATSMGSIWNAFAKPPNMMGVHLRSMLGPKLVIIGQSGGASAGTLPKALADTDGIDEALASAGFRHFVVDLRTLRAGTPERRWLDRAHPMRSNITLQMVVNPLRAFDALVYVDTLRPATRVK